MALLCKAFYNKKTFATSHAPCSGVWKNAPNVKVCRLLRKNHSVHDLVNPHCTRQTPFTNGLPSEGWWRPSKVWGRRYFVSVVEFAWQARWAGSALPCCVFRDANLKPRMLSFFVWCWFLVSTELHFVKLLCTCSLIFSWSFATCIVYNGTCLLDPLSTFSIFQYILCLLIWLRVGLGGIPTWFVGRWLRCGERSGEMWCDVVREEVM